MKKRTRIIISSIMTVVLAASPALSYAAQGNGNGKANGHAKNDPPAAAVQSKAIGSSNSVFNRLYGSFGAWFTALHAGKQASASTSQGDDNNGNNNGDNDNDGDNDGGSGSSTSTAPSDLPPVINGISSPTVLQVGQTGTWSVSASDPQNGSLTYSVNWGDQAVQPLAVLSSMNIFVQTSTFTHSYANPGTYTVTFTVEDSAGLTAVSSVTVHVSGQSQNVLAISNLSATSTNPRQGTVTWTTNQPANSSVWISTTSPVSTAGAPTASKSGFVYNHSVNLPGLTPGTTYHVVVGSTNYRGASTTSSETSFTTPAPRSLAPVISSITGTSTITTGQTGTWTVNAYDPRNEPLSYSVNWGDNGIVPMIASFFTGPVFVQTSTFTHSYANPGTYTISVTVRDSSGLSTASSTTVTVASPVATTTIPVISNVSAAAASTTATVSWTTDQSSDSTVYYSTSSPVAIGATSTGSATNSALVTSHSLAISGLTASTTYYAVVQSSDSAGTATSTQTSFTTSAAPAVGPTISNIVATPASTTAQVSWNTSTAADSELYFSTTSPVVAGAAGTGSTTDASLTTSHSLTATGLATGTTYYFLVKSKDASNNLTAAPQFSAVTLTM